MHAMGEIGNDSKINELYRPNLFKLISDQLHLVPLWSGVMIRLTGIDMNNEYLMNITRLSNNPVENHFGYLKKHLLNGKKVFPSEMTIKIFKMLKSKFLLHYEEEKGTIKYFLFSLKI